MKPKRQLHTLYPMRKLIVSAFLVLAILVALLPQPAQAAVKCRTYHFVREGDTTPYIAHTYGLKWKDIANANDMSPADKLEVGQRLCIPPESESETNTKRPVVPETDQNASIRITASGGRVYLNLAKFSENHEYRVKARDVGVGVGGWSKLGRIEIEKKTSYTFNFKLPDDLRRIPILSVCLKDMTSDELICRTVVNP